MNAFPSPQDRAFLAATADVLIPADDLSVGGAEAGVAEFIANQLAGPFGAGAGQYRAGPFAPGAPQQGWQGAQTPLELVRDGIAQIDAACRQHFGGACFADCTEADQTRVLQMLEADDWPLADGTGRVFFELLLQLAMEGYFADPSYGGNRDRAGWRLVGFPGPGHDYRAEIGAS